MSRTSMDTDRGAEAFARSGGQSQIYAGSRRPTPADNGALPDDRRHGEVEPAATIPTITPAQTLSSSYTNTYTDPSHGTLFTLSPTGLFTEYDISNLTTSQPVAASTQLKLPVSTSFPDIRFASPWAWRGEMVIAAGPHLILYNSERRNVWSENIGERILDVSADFVAKSVYILTKTEIRQYKHDIENKRLERNHNYTVELERPSDNGRIIVYWDSMYIIRGTEEGLVRRMDIKTHEIKPVISGLVRPSAISASYGIKRLAVADDTDVHIYSTHKHDLITTIHGHTPVTDVKVDDRHIFVLTGDKIKVYSSQDVSDAAMSPRA